MIARIAHISDVHYNRVDVGVADRLRHRLEELRPNLLIISGDLSDHPFTLGSARKWVDSLCDALALSTERQLFVVPGNHDLRLWGNIGLKPLTQCWYRHYFGSLSGVHFLEEHNVTIIRIDSNPIMRGFARGTIRRIQLANLQKELERADQRALIAGSTKIAVLHHHTFPVPFERSRIDEFLVLKNVHRLLQFLADNEVSLVLHGHNHMAPYSVLSLGTCDGTSRVLQVVGAGTAIAGGRDREARGHNFNFVTIEDGGLAYVRQFFAVPGNEFQEVTPAEPRIHCLDSGFRRVISETGRHYQSITWDASLDEEGDTFNEITYRGLHCPTGSELLRIDPPAYTADTGHLAGVWLNKKKTSEGVTIKNIDNDDPRSLTFEIHLPYSPSAERTIDYSLVAFDLNAISLTRTEYRRKFPLQALIRESEEMEMFTPADEFCWTMKFPSGYKLPHPPRFEVLEAESGRVHEWLTQALQSCFHFSDTLGYCFLRIKRPPINFSYKISWELPEEEDLPRAEHPAHRAAVERCTHELLALRVSALAGRADQRHSEITDVLKSFREQVAQHIDKLTKTTGVLERDDLEVSLMVYDNTDPQAVPVLRVVASTEINLPNSLTFCLEVGDGNAGRAFKNNTVRSFDLDNSEREPKQETYIRRAKTSPVHKFLYSMPLRHPETQHLIFGVLNIGSLKKESGNFLRILDTEEGYVELLNIAQNYVLIRVLETLNIPGVEGGLWQ